MTRELEKAFEEATKLSEEEQDSVAAWLLEELASERRWTAAFQGSQNELQSLADEALAEYREGNTRSLDPNKL